MSTDTDTTTGADVGADAGTTPRYDDLRRIESEVGTLIRRVKRVMGERAREVHPDLHPITYFILTHLAVHGPLRGADLSDAFGMDKGGVSRQVQTLVDLGLVERRPDAEDRRAILLDATEQGRERLRTVARDRSDRFDERLGHWSDAELATFARQLASYNAALSDD
jgi:DNA-binding MarR family transcriptional regulator